MSIKSILKILALVAPLAGVDAAKLKVVIDILTIISEEIKEG